MGTKASSLFLSCMLLAAAVAAGVATRLEWLPCQGSMLNGLLDFPYPAEGFSDACLARMDNSTAVPLADGAVEARAMSALLLALGWLGYASGLRLPGALRAVVLLPVVPVSWFAAAIWISQSTIWETTTVTMAIELSAFVAAAVILLHPGARHVRVPSLIGLWAVTAYGSLHLIGDYVAMISVSNANWDMPPGSGYLTAAAIAVCGVLVAVLGLRGPADSGTERDSAPSGARPHDDLVGADRTRSQAAR